MTPSITKILVPTDFSDTSDAALEYAKGLATTFGASLHLVHVFEDPFVTGAFAAETYAPMPPATRAAMLDEATDRLLHRLPADEQARFKGTTEIINGVSAPAIIEYARTHGIDLIVMGTHGRTGMAHLLMGSVAERVVRNAECPVLTVHREKGVVVHPKPEHQWLPEMPTEIPS